MSYDTNYSTSHPMLEFTTLFCTIDDFFQKNEAIYWQYLKQENPKIRQRSGLLCLSEIIYIAVWYKNSQLHHFKTFYGMIERFYAKLFKGLPSYQRIIFLINQHQLALQVLHISLTSKTQTECAWVDSTTLPVCKNQRIQRHKSLKQIATRGRTQWVGSMDANCMYWWMLRVNLFRPNSRMAILQI